MSQGISLTLGHAQQLVAAAFGHGTLASYQVASKAAALDVVAHVVLDVEQLQDRARDFALDGPATEHCVVSVLELLLPHARVHLTEASFVQAMQHHVDDRTLNDPEVSSETAMTNGGLSEIYMPLTLWSSLDLGDQEDHEEQIVGSISMEQEQDSERVYWGHKINVEANLYIERFGKRMFGRPQLKVTKAKLDWFGHSGDDDREERPRRVPLAQALAEVLGIEEADAQYLDYEESEDASDDGLVCGHYLEFGRTVKGDVAEKIRAKHPTMRVLVPPDFFDGVRLGADGGPF